MSWAVTRELERRGGATGVISGLGLLVRGGSTTMAVAVVVIRVVAALRLTLFLVGLGRDVEGAGAGESRDDDDTAVEAPVRGRLEEGRLEPESSLSEVDPDGDPEGDGATGTVRLPTINGDPRKGDLRGKKGLVTVLKVAKLIDRFP